MWRTFIKHADLVNLDPIIGSYRTDTTAYITKASERLMTRIQGRGIKLRQILLPLDLVLSTAKEDTDERMRFVTNLSSAVATTGIIYTLSGCNTEDGTFSSVTTISYSASESGEKSAVFSRAYKFYKVTANYTGTLSECFLVETAFDSALIFCALWLSFASLIKTPNDVWTVKALDYQQQYDDAFSELNFKVDKDDSGSYDETEKSQTVVSRLLI